MVIGAGGDGDRVEPGGAGFVIAQPGAGFVIAQPGAGGGWIEDLDDPECRGWSV